MLTSLANNNRPRLESYAIKSHGQQSRWPRERGPPGAFEILFQAQNRNIKDYDRLAIEPLWCLGFEMKSHSHDRRICAGILSSCCYGQASPLVEAIRSPAGIYRRYEGVPGRRLLARMWAYHAVFRRR